MKTARNAVRRFLYLPQVVRNLVKDTTFLSGHLGFYSEAVRCRAICMNHVKQIFCSQAVFVSCIEMRAVKCL